MSPQLAVPSKHRRLTNHVVRVRGTIQNISILRERSGDPVSSNETGQRLVEIVNKWWILFVIAIVVLLVLLVAVLVGIVKCCLKRDKAARTSKALHETAISDEKKAAAAVEPMIAHLGSRHIVAPGLSPNVTSGAPNIVVTPATASPSRTRFFHRARSPLTGTRVQTSRGDDDYDGDDDDDQIKLYREGIVDTTGLAPRLSSETTRSDFNGSEADIAHAPAIYPADHHLRLYHDQDLSHSYAYPHPDFVPEYESQQAVGKLDEVDLQSPSYQSPSNRSSVSSAKTVEVSRTAALAARVAAILAKSSSKNVSIDHEERGRNVHIGDDSEEPISPTSSEHDLTDAELAALALQFPPPAYPVKSRSKAGSDGTTEKTLPLRPLKDGANTSDKGDGFKFSLPQFTFQRPGSRTGAPMPPVKAASTHTASPPLVEPRPRSWTPPTAPVFIERPELSRMASHQDLHHVKAPSHHPTGMIARGISASRPSTPFQFRHPSPPRASPNRSRGRSPNPSRPRGRTDPVSDRYDAVHLARDTVGNLSEHGDDEGSDNQELHHVA
ncbi:hypothetical protein PIIN_03595 [Serendipita indica DSM 11827]|uniref:Uncharacterized protein n=1 Tax=Serendipita indica (strain DSM 11827) TaxID=1109443 RepID=G4TEB3_SERID|nr:hypothetical protein PIIN_03595 [Serendipita indica DSM 11827]